MSKWNKSLSMRRKNKMAISAQNPTTSDNYSVGHGNGMSCSTPEPQKAASSPCNSDSDAASPVPFLCTQDRGDGDTEVVWNYYTPNRPEKPQSRIAQHTPLSRKNKRTKLRNRIGQLNDSANKMATQPKKKPKESDKTMQLYQDLLEMNKNIQGFLEKTQKKQKAESRDKSGSEDDIFNSSGDRSPKLDSFSKSSTQSLRRNLLNSKYSRLEPEPALESDDSMNECLIRASQMIEEKVFSKRPAEDNNSSVKKCKIEQDSMDAILNNITLDSPIMKTKKNASLVNDSFENFMGNLNDSALERLTQLPIINESPKDNVLSNGRFNNKKHIHIDKNSISTSHGDSGWTIKELVAMDSVPSPRSSFSRHSSMPESPAPVGRARGDQPSGSGTALSRHNSLPWKRERPTGSSSEDSTPLRCTPEEIRRKHQQAREKLLAKRLFPNGNTQQSQPVVEPQTKPAPKFKPKFPTKNIPSREPTHTKTTVNKQLPDMYGKNDNSASTDIKSLIERKRMEALQKLKMKRSHSNMS